MKKHTDLILVLVAILGLAFCGAAQAANVTWDSTPGAVGVGDSTITGGAGTWDTVNGNWTIDGGANNIAWVNGSDTAIFGGSGATVTLGADVIVGGLSFTSSGYSIAPGVGPYKITLGAAGSTTSATSGSIYTSSGSTTLISADIDNAGFLLSLVGPGNATLSGNISGAGGLTTVYGGTTTLSGNNTYAGKTSISANTTIGSSLSISSLNSVNGGTPLLASSSLGCPTNAANGTIEIGTSGKRADCTLKYTGPGETSDRTINVGFNSSSSQTIEANVTGGGLLKFTSPFTGSGSTTPSGALILTGTGAGEISANIPDFYVGSKLTKNGAGTWTLSGQINNTGILTVSGGTLNLNATNATGFATSAIAVSGGTLNLNATNAISTRPVTISSTGRVNANAPYALGSCAITVTNSATLALTVDLSLMSTNHLTIAGAGKVQIDTGVRATVGSLFFGTNSMPDGVWGSTNSTAGNTSTNFTGTGKLYVGVDIPGDGTMVIVQ